MSEYLRERFDSGELVAQIESMGIDVRTLPEMHPQAIAIVSDEEVVLLRLDTGLMIVFPDNGEDDE